MSTNGYPPRDAVGTVYLLHYSGRTSQRRQHYLGWTSNIERRFRQHRSGAGCRETRKAVEEGLTLKLAQTWRGTPALEARIKQWSRKGCRGFSGICPYCVDEPELPPDIASELGAPQLRIYFLPPSARELRLPAS